MNVLTKFHEDWAINVASREKCPALGSHVFQAKLTIFEHIQDIIGQNLLSKFHEDRKINVDSEYPINLIIPITKISQPNPTKLDQKGYTRLLLDLLSIKHDPHTTHS
ncbi:hypothetical protein DPMN_032689 [Dreissena polymorpha]|uniref:Uncharacterized protein n=1 Tax=Dreissena polymorpha TaxID=45954 RepID=A0A9D4RKH3_DREPO|nr:hypothetical protein DPMN_032689 [Dreissena polymorpha]